MRRGCLGEVRVLRYKGAQVCEGEVKCGGSGEVQGNW